MNELTTFNYGDNPVRTSERNGETWFVLRDICDILTIGKTADVARRLDDDEKGVAQIDTLYGVQNMTIVNEAGLYNVILRSDKPEAKDFKRWVTHDVLPSIRKSGSYAISTTPVMSQLEILSAATQALVQHERQLAELTAAQEETAKRIERTENKLIEAADVFTVPSYNYTTWQQTANDTIKMLTEASGLAQSVYRGQLYRKLEIVAGCLLGHRLTRLRNRMKEAGATRRETDTVTKLTVIARDKKLRAIFDGILREEQAKYLILGA